MVETEPTQTTFAPYPAAAVANGFLNVAVKNKRLLLPMELMHLVYLAQGWYLATAESPLIDEPIIARREGPAIPSLAEDLKFYSRIGSLPKPVTNLLMITVEITDDADPLGSVGVTAPLVDDSDKNTWTLLRFVWRSYCEYSLEDLHTLVTQVGTPWAEAVEQFRTEHPKRNLDNDWPDNLEISHDLMTAYYRKVWSRTENG